jgi:hypothetical protein
MLDQVLGIGGLSLLVYLGVRITAAFRDYDRKWDDVLAPVEPDTTPER